MPRPSTALALLFFCFLAAAPASAQFISIAGGGLFPQDRQEGGDSATFGNASMFTFDAGTSVFPFVTAGVHYSRARPDFTVTRATPAFSAQGDFTAHTLTFDARLRTPQAFGIRLYGLAGVGLSRFVVDLRDVTGTVSPPGVPENATLGVFTYGGGIERSVVPLVRLKLEVRDYVSSVPDRFFPPGGSWHRVAVVGGITLGR
jgi:hypothetical protein